MTSSFRRIIALAITLIIVFNVIPNSAFAKDYEELITDINIQDNTLDASGVCGSGVRWTFNSSTGALTITGTGTFYPYDTGESPFYNQRGIKSITIESGVKSIGDYVFERCYNATTIVIGDTVTSIGVSAFASCMKLNSLTIGSAVKTIGDYAFTGCTSLPSVTVPDTVTTVGAYAFFDCMSLATVTLGKNTATISEGAFKACTSLTAIKFQSKTKTIGDSAFEGCTNLATVTFNTNLTSIGSRAFYECESIDSLSLPYRLTSIGDYAFCSCSSLSSLTFNRMLISIGNSAFRNCEQLTNINISDSVTTIGDYAFYDCIFASTLKLGKSVETIGDHAFDTCSSISAVNIVSTVTDIGEYAFANCESLTSFTVEDGNTSYSADEKGVLYNYDKSELIQYPFSCTYSTFVTSDTLTKICKEAFKGNTYLKTLFIPSDISTVEDKAFDGCTSLNNVYLDMPCSSWSRVSVGSNNSCFTNAVLHFSTHNFENGICHDCGINELDFYSTSHPHEIDFDFTWTVNRTGASKIFITFSEDTEMELDHAYIYIYNGADEEIGCYGGIDLAGVTVTVPGHVAKIRLVSDSYDITNYGFALTEIDAVYTCDHVDTGRVVVDAVEATCSKTGYSGDICCAICGELLEAGHVIPTSDHVGETRNASAATCTQDGYTGDVYCVYCDTLLEEGTVIPASGHTVVTDPAVAPTCSKKGLTEGSHCSVCGEVIVAQRTVSTLPHVEEIRDAVEATCTQDGYTGDIYCTVCDNLLEFGEEIPATGHTAADEWTVITPATCTVTGTKVKYCTVCNAVVETETIAMIPHTWDAGEITTAPTCTEAGVKTYTCTVCGATTTEEVAALGHDYEAVVTDPTCTEQGYTTYTCSRCDDSYVDDYVDATGHTPVTDAAVAPTCTETGLTEGSHCSVCNAVLTAQEVVPATGHTAVTDAAVAPTCTETGLTEGSHCSVCNTVLVAQETVPATKHTAVTDAAVAPTCTETGLTEGSHCSVCNTVLVAQEEVAALGHTVVVDKAVAPTCTEIGLTEGSHCSVCNTVLVAQETVAALGHTEETRNAAAPTCTQEGYTGDVYCKVCDELLSKGTDIPMAAHEYVDGVCVNCGAEDPDYNEPTLTSAESSSVIIDKDNGIIYGYTSIIDDENVIISELAIDGVNAEIVVTPTEYGYGTGTKVELVKNGNIIESYYIVVFGDANGDSVVDESDFVLVDLYNAFLYMPEEDSPEYMGMDCDRDGYVDENDMVLIDLTIAFLGEIDQVNGGIIFY